jgi:1,4-alpha-glucan branching enzyme
MKNSIPRGALKASGEQFTIKAPGARSVLLAADFTKWQEHAVPLKPLSDGIWSGSVALPPGTYHYRFLVDGAWQDDPECTRRMPNPYGSQNMVREVSTSQASDATFPTRNPGSRPIKRKRTSARWNKAPKPQPVVL